MSSARGTALRAHGEQLVAAGLQAARAFSSRQAGPVPGHLLLGLVGPAAMPQVRSFGLDVSG
ncbi:MAG: hypothetical protein ACHP9Z_31040 [Streptosporangiales bacterium]